MNRHHKKAAIVFGATVVADLILGTAYGLVEHIDIGRGLYCATGFATTDGCPFNPSGWLGYSLGALMMLTLIPLVGCVWAFVTTGLTTDDIKSHVDKRHDEMKEHVTNETNGS